MNTIFRVIVIFHITAALVLSSRAVAEQVPALEINGLIEVDTLFAEDYVGNRTADVTLATVGVAVSAALNEHANAHLGFLYEEDDTDFGLDEATLTLALGEGLSFTAGRMYIPFGHFVSFMISDPQTLVLSETAETALMVLGRKQDFYGAAYLFNGDSDEAGKIAVGDNNAISAGLNLGYAREGVFDLGLSYISNIADSNTLQGLSSGGGTPGMVRSKVAGGSAYFLVRLGNVTLLGEHVTALKHFSNGDLGGTVTGEEKPSASQIEIEVSLIGDVAVAAAYQRTREALFIGVPETVASLAVAYEVAEGVTLAAEYARMKDYAVSRGGTGGSAGSIIVQLAAGF